MNKPHRVDAEKQKRILEEATHRQISVTLKYKTTDEWLIFKSNFTNNVAHNGNLFITYPTSTDHPTPEITPGQNMDISFRWGNNRILLNTTVAGRYHDPAYNMTILELNPPNAMYEHQRRFYERALAPERIKIPVDLWIGDPNTNEPQSSAIIRGTIMDISAGGIGVTISNEHKPNCKPGNNVVCSFSVEKGRPPVIIYSQFHHWQDLDNGFGILGLQFTSLKATQQGQAQLEQILTLIKRFKQAAIKQCTNHL
ncbi:MAG: flagellar brake protein [Planctomycetota bacterium]|jgi:c-di-GMP-binding flagellar brake protein YcgR